MKLLSGWGIPSEYLKLDDRVTAADSFLDVASLQKARYNHNILVAQRIRRNMMSRATRGGYDNEAEEIYTVTPYTDSRRPPVYSAGTILISQGTERVQFSLYARRAITMATSPEFGFRFFTPGRSGPAARIKDESDLVTISINNSSYAWFTATVEVPEAIKSNPATIGGRSMVGYIIYLVCPIDTESTIFSGAAITDSGDNWLRTTGAGAIVDFRDCLYTNSAENSVGMITGTVSYGAADRKFFVDPPWYNTVSLSSTVTAAPINGVHLQSLNIAELAIGGGTTGGFLNSYGAFV